MTLWPTPARGLLVAAVAVLGTALVLVASVKGQPGPDNWCLLIPSRLWGWRGECEITAVLESFKFCRQCGIARMEYAVTDARVRDFSWLAVVQTVESCPAYCDRIMNPRLRESCRYTVISPWKHGPFTSRCEGLPRGA